MTPTATAACEAWCEVAGSLVTCDLPSGHSHEHEVTDQIEVGVLPVVTNFIVWWDDEGRAFVGSKDAVNTGGIT